MAIDYESIGSRIKRYRVDKGISQAELGELVFVNNQHISRAESGKVTLSLDFIISIANALEVSADDLLIDNLKVTSSAVGKELSVILSDCSKGEKDIIIRTAVFLKSLLDEFGI